MGGSESTQTTQTTQPAQSTQPAQPAQSTQPAQTTQAAQSTQPAQPTSAENPFSVYYRGDLSEIDPINFPQTIGETITLRDNRKLGYMIYGNKGKPTHNILFFPGTPGSRFFCPKEIPDHVTVFVLERPGIGLSDPKPNRSFLDWADDINEFVDILGIQQFCVIGYSSGSPYALAVAHKLGEIRDENGNKRLKGVSIVSTLSPPNTPNFTLGMPFLFKVGLYMATYTPSIVNWIVVSGGKQVLENPIQSGRKSMNSHSVYDQKLYRRKDVEPLFIRSSLEVHSRSQASAEAYEYTLWCQDWGFSLTEIKTKLVIYQGELDKATTTNMANFICSQVPESKLTLVPNSGHLCFFQIWDEMLAFLVSCLDDQTVGESSSTEKKVSISNELQGEDVTISL